MCDFLAGLDVHDFACLCMVLLLSMAWFCRVMTVDAMVCWDVISIFELWNYRMDFRIWGRGGLKVHSQRPRNPLTDFREIHDKD